MSKKALEQLLGDLREKYTAADVRKAFVARDVPAEAMLRRVAWTANINLANEPAHEQVWYGLEIFVGHPVLETYEWFNGGGRL